MKIAIIGAGYVGTTTAAAFAHHGHEVFVADNNQEKIKAFQRLKVPFYEDGLEEALKEFIQKNLLSFTTDIKQIIQGCEVIFLAVGTPSLTTGEADLSYIKEAAKEIGRYMNDYKVIVIKSTVPVGTVNYVQEVIQDELKARKSNIPFDTVSNPEFLREGKAMEDAIDPERIVIGSDSERAETIMRTIYKEFRCPNIMCTSPKNAEMIKYASNSFLAAKISFMNELARLCDVLGVDVAEVSKGMGLDSRIGHQFLQAGIGYGGSCFPKDTKALAQIALQRNLSLGIVEAVCAVNETQAQWFLEKAENALGSFSGKQITVLGLTFKPDTDDIREASSLKIIDYLVKKKALISVFDPKGMEHVKKLFPGISYKTDPLQALTNADAAIIATEWKQFTELDWKSAKKVMAQPYIFDGRNSLDPEVMKNLGYVYMGVGRPPL
ncbi:UDP-glucose dehydrogenase family protein [Falsibacillus albus]|uniref:UDP-glucose 6-dehydrogenase n=1 Tax=Falsibacillus albus TaxID=2478915 RepID=A0A3L7JS04_9BACI|nr:UDP-glucose/GDP-mannose dehydrogenase family protein [Falsibacillus albus]RLQ93104.1 UDP-glucose/GDP-mannose dehydrogenase family protein [Falsibacillus albus]